MLVARVEDRRGISHLSVARSPNGVTDWTIDPTPLLAPNGDVGEEWGFEDARVVWVEELETVRKLLLSAWRKAEVLERGYF